MSDFCKLILLPRAARTVSNNDHYEKIFNALSDEQKKLIDIIVGLEKSDESNGDFLSWKMLKLEPKKPTTNNIKTFVQYVNKMRELRQRAVRYGSCVLPPLSLSPQDD